MQKIILIIIAIVVKQLVGGQDQIEFVNEEVLAIAPEYHNSLVSTDKWFVSGVLYPAKDTIYGVKNLEGDGNFLLTLGQGNPFPFKVKNKIGADR